MLPSVATAPSRSARRHSIESNVAPRGINVHGSGNVVVVDGLAGWVVGVPNVDDVVIVVEVVVVTPGCVVVLVVDGSVVLVVVVASGWLVLVLVVGPG
jgi:hypothetical protein